MLSVISLDIFLTFSFFWAAYGKTNSISNPSAIYQPNIHSTNYHSTNKDPHKVLSGL